MADEDKIKSNQVLEDGIITGCALRHIHETFEKEEREERILNGSLSMVCTYPEGYKERQSLYVCFTCHEKTGQLAGICFACSENCHGGHDLMQLYTKRLFCCDCGNSRFNDKNGANVNRCVLFEEKSSINRKNKYGENFKGKYCTCGKPYPPPEDDPMYGVAMFQCFMCEDWFHGEHINADILRTTEDYVEMCCPVCSVKFPFIREYHRICAAERIREDQDLAGPSCDDNADPNATTTTQMPDDNDVSEGRKPAPINNKETEDKSDCYYGTIRSTAPDSDPAALLFFNTDWRPMLCRCIACKRMYEDLDCEFLLNEGDSVYLYLLKNASDLEKDQRDPQTALYEEIAMRTNPDVAHSAVLEINTVKHKLHAFLSQKADKDEIITDQDIYTFFDELKVKRRRFHEPSDDEK